MVWNEMHPSEWKISYSQNGNHTSAVSICVDIWQSWTVDSLWLDGLCVHWVSVFACVTESEWWINMSLIRLTDVISYIIVGLKKLFFRVLK